MNFQNDNSVSAAKTVLNIPHESNTGDIVNRVKQRKTKP